MTLRFSRISLKPLLFVLCLLMPLTVQAQAQWALLPATLKVIPGETEYTTEVPALHAGRGEYAPFQVMLAGEDDLTAPTIEASPAAFTVSLYEQWFFPMPEEWITFDYASSWVSADIIADGLQPINSGDPLTRGARGTAAVWVDLFVNPEAPAGDYDITVTVNGESRVIPITVYPVDMPTTGAMSVLIPIDDGANMPHFAELNGMDTDAYHRELNQVMYDHYAVPGEFVGDPVWTGNSWDFSAYTEEISQIPFGDDFHAPPPFDLQSQRFLFTDADGEYYTESAFDDPYFVEQLNTYFSDLSAYITAIERKADALLYPTDETFWVADEPDNNGPAGLLRLQQWAEPILGNDLGLMGSRVFPVRWGPDWPDPEQLITDSHVPVAYLDAAPELFEEWASEPGRTYSIYLNLFGDSMNISAAMNRGIVWHIYARGSRTVAGYGALEWYDESYSLIDVNETPDLYTPHTGYGSGALIYPDNTPSLRLKLLREGVEDMRLLDLYAIRGGDARAFAYCLTPTELGRQDPPPEMWHQAHQALLAAVAEGRAVNLETACPPTPAYDEVQVLHDPERDGLDGWDFEGMEASIVPFEDGQGMRLEVVDESNYAFYWYGESDWSGYEVLQLDVFNETPYFADLDVAIGDGNDTYMLLMNTSQIVAPEGPHTVEILLDIPPSFEEAFDWSTVAYIELATNTSIQRRDIFTQELYTFDTGLRTLVVDNIRLAR